MDSLTKIQLLAVIALPVLLAITVHEAAHGLVAKRLGDKTASMLGRVTLNPLKHIDPIGTVAVPMAMFFFTGILFGWAKPVPVDWRNLKHPRRDMALVALAGPMANLAMAVVWSLMLVLSLGIYDYSEWVALPLTYMSAAGVLFNILLMVLNLMPVLPLDGGRIVTGILPPRAAYLFSRLEPYGILIIIALLVSGILWDLIWPVMLFSIDLLPGANIVKELFLV